MSGFSGFGSDTIAFIDALGRNNTKPWFDANRDAYLSAYLAPAQDFITAIGPALQNLAPGVQAIPKVNGSIFRINRDVRFSKDKTPYKDHLDLWFWEGERKSAISGFFFRLTGDLLILGAGAHGFRPDVLKAYRAALAHPNHRNSLIEVAASLEAQHLPVNGQTYSRTPAGYNPIGDRTDTLILHSALYSDVTAAHPASLNSPDFVDHCIDVFTRTLPLHQWLVRTLG